MEQQEIQQGVAEQIKELFVLANSTTSQNEREIALRSAFNLIAKHNINLAGKKTK